MPHHIIVETPDEEPVHYVLQSNRIGVGRNADNQVQLDSERISGSHLELTISDSGACWVEDLDSANGTLINGIPLEGSLQLSDGDRLLLGNVIALHYFVPNSDQDEPCSFLKEVNDEQLTSDLVALQTKRRDMQSQVNILNNQYEAKLRQFRLLVTTIEKLKSSMGNSDGPDPAVLDEAREKLAKEGIRVERHDLDIDAQKS